jgi:transmembrane sensor
VIDRQRQHLRDEAAMWFARMMRPDAERYRYEFEIWLQADETHRESYRRIQRRYEASGVLAQSPIRAGSGAATFKRRWLMPAGLGLGGVAAGVAAAALMLLTLSWAITTVFGPDSTRHGSQEFASVAPVPNDAKQIASPVGEIRTLSLSDGSKVTLDTASRLILAFNDHERRLVLSRGRARFEVAHEDRPFVVVAGNGTITAHGTIFDVDLRDHGQVQVALLRGAVDVKVGNGPNHEPAVRRLRPDQNVEFDPTGFVEPTRPIRATTTDWPSGIVDVDSMPLPDLLREADRYAEIPIVTGAPELNALKVSGRFRIDRPQLLARNLADLFDLDVDRSRSDRIVLEKKISASENPS